MSAGPLFDAVLSNAEKHHGMTIAAEAREALLLKVRAGLKEIAVSRADRCVTADDAHTVLLFLGYRPDALGNAAGSLFRGGDWEFTGRWAKSERIEAHANDLRVWRLKQ